MDADLFRDRNDAGKRLAEQLLEYENSHAVVLAIPRGGVPVGFEVARRLNASFDVTIPRKIPIPWNPEAGLGAITADGTMVLNEQMIRSLGLSKDEIRQAADEVHDEIIRRTDQYRGNRPLPELEGRPVILVDDGLASGYTMLAAITSLKKYSPSDIIVAVPVASSGSARLISQQVDNLVTLILSHRLPFAVASYYIEWKDLTDDEVLDYLERARESAHV